MFFLAELSRPVYSKKKQASQCEEDTQSIEAWNTIYIYVAAIFHCSWETKDFFAYLKYNALSLLWAELWKETIYNGIPCNIPINRVERNNANTFLKNVQSSIIYTATLTNEASQIVDRHVSNLLLIANAVHCCVLYPTKVTTKLFDLNYKEQFMCQFLFVPQLAFRDHLFLLHEIRLMRKQRILYDTSRQRGCAMSWDVCECEARY